MPVVAMLHLCKACRIFAVHAAHRILLVHVSWCMLSSCNVSLYVAYLM
jgi:hypothetical protein